MRTPGRSSLDPLAPWSMPQIQSFAQAQARAAIDPILASIDRQQANNTANITGFSEAMARTLAPIGRQVQDAYQAAGGMQGAFGAGFADAMRAQGAGSTAAGAETSGSLAGLIGSLSSIASRGLGVEGAAQTSLADRYALAPAADGQRYLREAQGRFDQQRADVRSKVPEAVQQIIQGLLDREIQKEGLRANKQALQLERDKFTESTRQFDEGLAFDREKFDSDARYRDQVLRAQDEERTQRLRDEKKDRKAAANDRKAQAIDSASLSIADSVAAKLEPQYADRIIGLEPKVAKIVQVYETKRDRFGEETRTPTGEYETIYYAPDGSLTKDPAKAAQEPVYEKVSIEQAGSDYYSLRKDVIGQLRLALRRYGLKDDRYETLADSILSRWFDVDFENWQENRPDQGFDYSSSLDAGYP
ncbi:MAG: hypothetical protein R3C15_19715 [Thermoleophilia bacterium]